jgi:hypothetical protein
MLRNGRIFPGNVFRVSNTFTDEDGTLVDPATVSLRTYDPSGRISAPLVYGTDAEMQRVSAGYYTCDITPDAAGRWHFRWTTTTPTSADEGDFIVIDSPFVDSSPLDYS